MRCKEKYGIVNVSMHFDNAGQVNISLSLAMRGASDFRTETISSAETGTGDIIRQVRDLSTQVGELRRRRFRTTHLEPEKSEAFRS
jgi:exoribonuclease II